MEQVLTAVYISLFMMILLVQIIMMKLRSLLERR